MRTHTVFLISSALVAAAIAGCSAGWEREFATGSATSAHQQAVLQRAQTLPEPTDESATELAVEDLDGLVAWAVTRHPDVRVRLAAVDRLAARSRQVGALPNPRLTIAPLGAMAETAAGEVGLMTGLSQTFPAIGSLRARTAMADADTREAIAQVRAAELTVANRVRQAWWRWHGAEQSAATVATQLKIMQQLLNALEPRLASGQVRQGELLRLRAELSALRTRQRGWTERAELATADLRAALSLGPMQELPEISTPASTTSAGDLNYFLAAGLRHRPDYARNDAAQAKAAAQAQAARAQRRPDVTVSFNYNVVRDRGLSPVANGDDQWWLGVGFSLPVWTGAYAAADAEAAAALRQARWGREAIADQVGREVRRAWLAVASAQDQLAAFQQQILPDARQALELERAAYAAGTGSYLDLIDAWRRLVTFELQAISLRQDLGTSQAELLAASGFIQPEPEPTVGETP